MTQISKDDLNKFSVSYSINDDKYILVDPQTRTVVNGNANLVFNRIPNKVKTSMMAQAPEVKVIYDPYLTTRLGRTYDEKLKIKIEEVTSYIAPQWHGVETKPELPADWLKFFKHLFPLEADRKYVYTWVHFLLTARNQTMLYLSGAKGTGKTTFANLLGALVGMNNYHVAKNDFASSRFNSFLDKNQLVVMDEFKCRTDIEKNVLKSIANDVVSVEPKGVDQYNVENRCSFLILNNIANMLRIEPDDRRFSIPEITGENILHKFGEEYLQGLTASMSDDETLAKIGNFFRSWKPTQLNFDPYKGKFFYQVVHKSCGPVYKFLIDYFVHTESSRLNYESLKEEFFEVATKFERPKYYPDPEEIKFFFEYYLHNGRKKLVSDVEYKGKDVFFILDEVSEEDIDA